MKKYVLLLLGVVNFAAFGMDNAPDSFERIADQMPMIFEYMRSLGTDNDVDEAFRALAYCNKRLSGAVFNEYFNRDFLPRLQGSAYPKEPLYFIMAHRGFAEELNTGKFLWVARHYLRNGHNPNDLINDQHYSSRTQFQSVVFFGDQKLAKVMMEFGADPYKTVFFCRSGGPNCNFNAFHWEQMAVKKFSFDELEYVRYPKGSEPEGWLKDLCKQVEAEREKAALAMANNIER